MKNKRILISCNRTLAIGGIEKALANLLRTMNLEDNDVTLILADDKGPLQQLLPHDHLKIIYTSSIDAKALLMDDLRHFRLIKLIKGLWNRLLLRLDSYWYTQIYYQYRIIKRKLIFPHKFDCAISYTTDMSDLSIVAHVDAAKRICFVHSDATAGKRSARLNDCLFSHMDCIFAVSQRTSEQFTSMHPKYNNIMDVCYNLVDVDEIIKQANEPVTELTRDGALMLCTVGRLSSEKGQQMIPKAAQILKDKGYNFRWYLVGDGPTRNSIETDIVNRGLSEQIITVGAKTNPYPYINACDIYIQPSFIEALSVTVIEAKILNKAIVTTDAPGMRELISSGETGLILDTMTPEALADGIAKLLDHPELSAKFVENLRNESFDNETKLQKLYSFIDS
jgi:glycosyltransferase involved in cell wall biosynthesis